MGRAGESTQSPCVCPPRLPVHPSRGTCPLYVGLTSSRLPVVFLPSLPQGYRVLYGGGQGHRKCLLGACGPGQSWQQTRGGKDILRSLRNLHSPLLLPPPLTPSFKGEERWGGGGEAAESAPRCLPGVWRAEQAMALDSRPPPLDRSQGVGAEQGFGLSSGCSCLAQGPEKRRIWVP